MNNKKKYILNSIYAPGISTYGADGQPGERGRAGYGIYYVPFNVDLSIHNEKDEAFNTVISAIRSNSYISNIATTKYFLTDRVYQVNDLFVTKIGKLFRLKTLADDITFELCGSLLGASEVFKIENNSVYNSSGSNFVFRDEKYKNDSLNADSFMYIKTDNNKLLKIVNDNCALELIKYDSISGESSTAFNVCTTNSKILIDNLYVDKLDERDDVITVNINNKNKEYYKIAAFEYEDDVNVTFGDKIIITNQNKNLLNILGINNNEVIFNEWASSDRLEITNININKIYIIITSNSTNSVVSKIKTFEKQI